MSSDTATVSTVSRPLPVQAEMDRLVEQGLLLRRLGEAALGRGEKSLGRALCFAGDKIYARWRALADKYPC